MLYIHRIPCESFDSAQAIAGCHGPLRVIPDYHVCGEFSDTFTCLIFNINSVLKMF